MTTGDDDTDDEQSTLISSAEGMPGYILDLSVGSGMVDMSIRSDPAGNTVASITCTLADFLEGLEEVGLTVL